MPNQPDDRPLIVTALMAPECFAFLDDLRRQHFPPALNVVPAHISLFHHLPGACATSVVETVLAKCKGHDCFGLLPLGVRFLGRGVAVAYEANRLVPLHAALARDWADWLAPQDRQPFKPHVTIQNKVAPDVAKSLFAAMKTAVLPVCRVEGIAIWRYLGGPWETVATCPFAEGVSQVNRAS